jgi:Leucine-rich repeat (LRR) protein
MDGIDASRTGAMGASRERGQPGTPERGRQTAGPMNALHIAIAIKQCAEFKSKALDLSGMGIEWTPRIPDHVEMLDLAGNQLSELPDDLPCGLKKLDISGNAIERITAGLPKGLRQLLAARNTVRSIEALPRRLEWLDISCNRLLNLPDKWPATLTRLDASANLLDDFPYGLPESLRILNLSDNLIDRLPTRLPFNLRDLCVDRNELLTSLPVFEARRLERFSASACAIGALPRPLPPTLRQLYVPNNLLTLLSAMPRGLQILDASHNKIERVEIHDPLQLEKLGLFGNRLATWPGFVASWHKAVCRRAPMTRSGDPVVRHVELSHNPFVQSTAAAERVHFHNRQQRRSMVVVYTHGDRLRTELNQMRLALRKCAAV